MSIYQSGIIYQSFGILLQRSSSAFCFAIWPYTSCIIVSHAFLSALHHSIPKHSYLDTKSNAFSLTSHSLLLFPLLHSPGPHHTLRIMSPRPLSILHPFPPRHLSPNSNSARHGPSYSEESLTRDLRAWACNIGCVTTTCTTARYAQLPFRPHPHRPPFSSSLGYLD